MTPSMIESYNLDYIVAALHSLGLSPLWHKPYYAGDCLYDSLASFPTSLPSTHIRNMCMDVPIVTNHTSPPLQSTTWRSNSLNNFLGRGRLGVPNHPHFHIADHERIHFAKLERVWLSLEEWWVPPLPKTILTFSHKVRRFE